MRVRPYGPEAWLVDEIADPVAWAAGLRSARLEGVIEVVAAERTVLVRCDRERLATIGARFEGVTPADLAAAVDPVVIPVRYDGDDLGEVAKRTGMTVEEVVDRHAGGVYTVRFCGFAPGFAYLGGLDPVLELPRRESPRTRVAAGSVAIAAHYTAVYPAPSPGGWHLLGRTDEKLWDPLSATPSRLVPGTTVRFRDSGSR
jgi:KipI family sensor histidine kinase inhibitor